MQIHTEKEIITALAEINKKVDFIEEKEDILLFFVDKLNPDAK